MAATLLSIDPKVLASIKDFDWVIRTLAHGSHVGKRISKKTGQGMEFNQYRPYSQGDDLRQLDWKMYARTEKFYIKQSEVETNISVTFILDNTRSMTYTENGLSKLMATKLLTGVMSHVALKNGDKVGIAGNPGLIIGSGDRHWKRLLFHLHSLKEVQQYQVPHIENIKARELFVVLTDMYDDHEEWQKFILGLKSPKNEVIVFHVLGALEQNLELEGAVKFKDLESGKTLETFPASFAEDYKKKLKKWQKNLGDTFRKNGLDYHTIDFTTPMDQIINTFLHRRKQLL